MMFRRNKSLTFLAVCMVAVLFVSIPLDSAYVQAAQPPIKLVTLSPDQAKEVAAAIGATAAANAPDGLAEALSQIPAIDYFSLSENARQQKGSFAEGNSLGALADNPSIAQMLRLEPIELEDGSRGVTFNAEQPLFEVDENGQVRLNLDFVQMAGDKIAFSFRRTPRNVSDPGPSVGSSTPNGERIKIAKLSSADAQTIAETMRTTDKLNTESARLAGVDEDSISKVTAAIVAALDLDADEVDASGRPSVATDGLETNELLASTLSRIQPTIIPGSNTPALAIDMGGEPLFSLEENGQVTFHGLESIIVTEERIVMVLARPASGMVTASGGADGSVSMTAGGPACSTSAATLPSGQTWVFCTSPNCSGTCIPFARTLLLPVPALPGFFISVVIITCECI